MKKLPAFFYSAPSGNQPVRDWLRSLSPTDRKIIGGDVRAVEFGWPVGMPVCRSLKGGLWEIRSTIGSGKVEARVYFAVDAGGALLLAAHAGKGAQDREIQNALARWADYLRRKRN